ncbi:methylamine utilization protein MauD [Acetobacter sp. LMG 32666]|uniref:methylamine utilization protein MauD n=1 Tax=Acetobacter sp. LMG 32666 TaxID=2959295 RepID=UPI0038D24C47
MTQAGLQTLVLVNGMLSLLLCAAFFVAYRMVLRLRRLFQEIAPVGALTNARGPQPGDACPTGTFATLDGQTMPLAGGATPRLLLFVSATCPISRKVIPLARNFCATEQLELVLAGDDNPVVQTHFAQQTGTLPARFINDPALGRALEVDKLPAAFLLDQQGVLIARGLVNNREHLESLLNAWESGFGTVQAYITHTRKAGRAAV